LSAPLKTETGAGDLEEDYRRYRPTLLAALGTLGRSGYAVAPADGLELVHDFFLEVWPDVRRRFDPARGSFASLLVVAFYRFARARIARDLRLRASRIPIDEVEDRLAGEDAAVAEALDAAAVARALGGLPAPLRRVLEVRFGGESERAAARELRLSRHGLREQLLEALGRVAVAMETQGELGDREWRLARLLWAEERSESDAAVLQMTPSQLRLARRRVLEALERAMPERAAGSEPAMEREPDTVRGQEQDDEPG
jgi:hypothetical protein